MLRRKQWIPKSRQQLPHHRVRDQHTHESNSAPIYHSEPTAEEVIEQHTSINYDNELFHGMVSGSFDDPDSQSNDPLETPSTKRRRLLGSNAAKAVNASRRRFEQRGNKTDMGSRSQCQVKEEPQDIIVIDSSDDEDDIRTPRSRTLKEDSEDRQIDIPPDGDNCHREDTQDQNLDTHAGARDIGSESDAAQETQSYSDPWPEHFVELGKTFKALNTVYAFCSGRKHMATTYETIKSSVEGLMKRPLEIMDIAQIKSLCPDLVTFAYVEQELLQIHGDGPTSLGMSRRNDVERMSKATKALAHRRELDQVYEQAAAGPQNHAADSIDVDSLVDGSGMTLQGGGWQDDAVISSEGAAIPRSVRISTPPPQADEGIEDFVLFFEFNDGTLKGPKATARGRVGMRRGPSRKEPKAHFDPKRNELHSPSAMKKLIEKRNRKFGQAVVELLSACSKKGEDPVQLIIAAAEDHVPVNPDLGRKPTGETPKKRKIRLEYFMANPDQRPNISEVIDEVKLQPWYKNQIVPGGHRTIGARPARHEQLTFLLTQEIVNALWASRQIEEFYVHQAEALNALEEGKNVIVCTSTSSGKSLIYQVPVLKALQTDFNSTAMYIFPTKALAQDQKRSLQDLLMNCASLQETIVANYDGDTPKDLRPNIRDRASVIFTNPDMLHQSILPSENLWRRFLRGLKFVVVDELHMYNGLFGAHVSLILRRLRRICHALGNYDVRFVSCSATVANPIEHMQTLFGIEDVEVITEDGSPTGRKEWLVWNPPLIDDNDPKQGRVSAYAEVSKIFRHLVERGVRTIVFTKVRRTCEIVMNQIRNDLLVDSCQDIVGRVMSYRSGYSPEDRRKIEQDMFKGALLGIVATSALELGIDIGTLDAVIMLGFPYTISSLRQQAGRAGRRQKDSLAVLVGDPFPMDQHYMRNPEEIFTQPDTVLSVDLTNDFVLEGHLQCAAMEMPIQPHEDAKYFGDEKTIQLLCNTRLEKDDESFYHCRAELRPNPALTVALRGARQVSYVYIDDTPNRRGGPRVMEEVEVDRAIFEAFEGAVFMHQGLSYICKDIDHERRIARMVQSHVNYHTRPRDHTDTDAVETHRIRALRDSSSKAYFGHIRIASYVWGYFKVDRRANILDEVQVDSPPYIRDTKGLWIDVPMWLINALTEKTINAAAAIHAAEHALLSLTPMFVVSLAGDVRTECKVAEREYAKRATTRKRPARLIFYDAPGQNGGICTKAFEHLDGLIRIAISVIESCPCLEGCPSCVTSHTCAHANLVTSKVGALGVLRGLVGFEPFDANLPMQNEPGHAQGHLDSLQAVGHTIEEAPPVRTINGSEVPVEEYDEEFPPSLQAFLDRHTMLDNQEAPRTVAAHQPWQIQNQRFRQAYAAPPVGKSMHYDEDEG